MNELIPPALASKIPERPAHKRLRSDPHGTIEKIVSGGQTGVDRAALDVALELGIDCGGWCPKGRRAEDGVISDRYPLQEAPTANYAERTALNVRDSDGTLILAQGTLRGGTALTKQLADRYRRPCLIVDPRDASVAVGRIRDWLQHHSIRVLNVAGPRENSRGEVAPQTQSLLHMLLASRVTRRAARSTTNAKAC